MRRLRCLAPLALLGSGCLQAVCDASTGGCPAPPSVDSGPAVCPIEPPALAAPCPALLTCGWGATWCVCSFASNCAVGEWICGQSDPGCPSTAPVPFSPCTKDQMICFFDGGVWGSLPFDAGPPEGVVGTLQNLQCSGSIWAVDTSWATECGDTDGGAP